MKKVELATHAQYTHLLFTLAFRPMRMPDIQIICLLNLYKPHTILSTTLNERTMCPVTLECISSIYKYNMYSTRSKSLYQKFNVELLY